LSSHLPGSDQPAGTPMVNPNYIRLPRNGSLAPEQFGTSRFTSEPASAARFSVAFLIDPSFDTASFLLFCTAQNLHLSTLSNSTECELPSPELTESTFKERHPSFCKHSWDLLQIRSFWRMPVLSIV
jgi:hypothetical protein